MLRLVTCNIPMYTISNFQKIKLQQKQQHHTQGHLMNQEKNLLMFTVSGLFKETLSFTGLMFTSRVFSNRQLKVGQALGMVCWVDSVLSTSFPSKLLSLYQNPANTREHYIIAASHEKKRKKVEALIFLS